MLKVQCQHWVNALYNTPPLLLFDFYSHFALLLSPIPTDSLHIFLSPFLPVLLYYVSFIPCSSLLSFSSHLSASCHASLDFPASVSLFPPYIAPLFCSRHPSSSLFVAPRLGFCPPRFSLRPPFLVKVSLLLPSLPSCLLFLFLSLHCFHLSPLPPPPLFPPTVLHPSTSSRLLNIFFAFN